MVYPNVNYNLELEVSSRPVSMFVVKELDSHK
jgi:hypothetical protein